jgi:hypothetical protein
MAEYEPRSHDPDDETDDALDWDFYGGSAEEFWDRVESFEPRVRSKDDIQLGCVAGRRAPVYLPLTTFQRHMYIVGDSGAGKTTLIKQLIERHIQRGQGFAVIDPKGGLLEHIQGRIACAYYRTHDEGLLDRVVVVDPTHPTLTATFNPLEPLPNTSSAAQAAELVSTFHKIWSDSWGPRMEDLMRNSSIAGAEAGLTLVDLLRFFEDANFRAEAMERVSHPYVIDYFKKGGEFDQHTRSAGGTVTFLGPVRTKLRAFLSDERVAQMLSFPQSSFNLRDIMDNRKILLINVPVGQLRSATWLLSALFMSKITLAVQSRTDTLEEERVPFYLYADEFSSFANDDFEYVLSQARSFKLSIIMAHQNYGQVSTGLRGIAMGNSQARVAFRLGERSDADYYARQIFTYSQDEVKRQRQLKSGDISYTYRSSGEQRELLAERINQLPDLIFYVEDKLNRDITRAQTAHLPAPFKELSMSEEQARDYISNLPIGRKYLVERHKIEQRETVRRGGAPAGTSSAESFLTGEVRTFLEYIADNPNVPATRVYKALNVGVSKGNQLRDVLREKGLIEQHETRLGQKGRPAKFFIPTFKALDLLGKERPKGRGETTHRHIQQMLVTHGLAKGYQVQIEKPLQDGGAVDVHLENQYEKVACEVAIESRPGRELAHIRHCLDAGYDRIFTLFSDEDKLARTKERLRDSFTEDELRSVILLPLWKIGSFL